MPTVPRLRTAALAAVLLGVLSATPALADDAPAPDLASFGIAPAGPERPDGRSFLSYTAAPGSTIQDHVAVLNQAATPVGLELYGGDIVQGDRGLAVVPHAQANTDAGSWLVLGGPEQITVPGQTTATGIGYTIVPFTVSIPANAQPGDHVGGIVASLVTTGSGGANSPAIQLDQRVAARVYVTVSGDLAPGLEVGGLTATWEPDGVLGRGTVTVTYTVRNTGNMRMAVQPSARVAGPFGLLSTRAQAERIDELLPGGQQQQTVTVDGVWPAVLESVQVSADALAPSAGVEPELAPVSASVRLWAVPWLLLGLLLVLVGLGTWRLRRRRAGARRPADAPAPTPVHVGSALFERQHDAARSPSRKERGSMRLSKLLTGVLAGSLLAGVVGLAAAGPAAAADEGPLLPGNIRWHTVAGPLDQQTAATTISSGVSPTAGVNPRPWKSLTVDQKCPANTTSAQVGIRIPQVGVPENDWDQVPVGAVWSAVDAQGRFYMDVQPDRLNRAQITTYNEAHPNATGNQFPFIVACRDSGGIGLGYFKTTITVVGGTDPLNYSWSIPAAPALSSGAAATTTTLAATASGADLVLSATVAPAAAGTVTFQENGATLGTGTVTAGVASYTVTAPALGAHTYTASFAPTDPAAFAASTAAPLNVTVGSGPNGTITVTLTVPAAPLGEPGSLVFTVPAGANVALTGQRDTGNTRVTAAGTLPTLTVADTRRDDLLTGWQVNVQASDFTGTAGVVGAKYLGWAPGLPVVTKDAGAPLTAQAGPSVASFLDDATSGGLGASKLLGKSLVNGRGTTTLAAALNLAIPASTAEGSYTSTVTVTLIGG
ncbi:Ig-like domain-containing protein [Cellulomonas sp. ICMP 17802]|uniref:Ig-like domain-containing protein n=1 Tax=Cellulomonas sp. ICMP 17802 TaxID=3239199 RepID=UPI00351B502C